MRLDLRLGDKNEWVRVFDPRGGAVFVRGDEPPDVGTEVRVDLTMDQGPRVILRGYVVWRRISGDADSPAGCSVTLSPSEREKINFLNGYVRGGLLNRRERRRLPLRLPVTYGALDGPRDSFTRDLNEEGCFILTEDPLPEGTLVHFVLYVPIRELPLELKGTVSHTVVLEDEDVPGMGVLYALGDAARADLGRLVDRLEADFMAGTLPEEVIT